MSLIWKFRYHTAESAFIYAGFRGAQRVVQKKNHLYNLNIMLKSKNALKVWQKAFLSADTPTESRKTKSVWKGHSAEDIADTLNISVSLVKEWIEKNAPASTNNI